MTKSAHLWAVGFDGSGRAAEVQNEITKLSRETHELVLLDVAVAVRYADGLLTLNAEPFPLVTKTPKGAVARFLACLALGAPPLCAAAVGVGLAGAGLAAEVGIGDDFIREVAALVKPETSVLFVLDEAGNMDAILHSISGLGGTELKTNVDAARAKLIQSALSAPTHSIEPS